MINLKCHEYRESNPRKGRQPSENVHSLLRVLMALYGCLFISMKLIPLTQGYSTMVDDEDFEWLNQWKWFANKSGYTFYAMRSPSSGKIIMHRIILDVPNGLCTDHIDGNGLNNQRSNLRICTKSQNGMNRIFRGGNKSGFKGIFYYDYKKLSKPWIAKIRVNGKQFHLGYFKTPKIAAKAYNDAALKYHGEFACLNSI